VVETAISFAVFAGIIGGLITGLVAYPIFRRLVRRGKPTVNQTIFFGVACGNIPAAIVIAGQTLLARDGAALSIVVENARAALFGTLLGAVGSAVFWLIAGRHIVSKRDAI
jgi:hypothetical protein